jgi:hypothetical protein
MTSKGLGKMVEGDFADLCTAKLPLMPFLYGQIVTRMDRQTEQLFYFTFIFFSFDADGDIGV